MQTKGFFLIDLINAKTSYPLAKRVLKTADLRIRNIFSAMTGSEPLSTFRLISSIYPLQIPLQPHADQGWKPYFLFKGFTTEVKSMSCHAAVLINEHMPHLPHEHKEEEILLLLDGEVDLIVSDGNPSRETKRIRLKSGEFVYYPSNFAHTLQTISQSPANYLMFKWLAKRKESHVTLKYNHYNAIKCMPITEGSQGFHTRLLFEGSTAFLQKFHCHLTALSPQSGYKPHIDDYDVSIIVLEGEVETLGKRVGPYGVIFYAAGEPHGMYNPGEVTAKYLVFEFHGHPPILVRIIKRFSSMIVRLRQILR